MNVILFALFLHFLGDFFLQPREMAMKKSSQWGALIGHCTIIWLTMIPLAVAAGAIPSEAFMFATLNSIIHGAIDRNIWKRYKIRAERKGTGFHYWNDYIYFLVIGFDQFLHASTMFLLLWWVVG